MELEIQHKVITLYNTLNQLKKTIRIRSKLLEAVVATFVINAFCLCKVDELLSPVGAISS